MKKELSKKYHPQLIEDCKYQFWKKNNFFTRNNKKATFSIVLPPPNVTGKLHLGHAWDGTLQDIIIRYKKLQGYDTLFLPGMDHAGIATQIKVEQRIRETKNITRSDLTRDELVNQIWEWKEEYADIIRQQWAKLGLALDYNHEQFTLNLEFSKAVNLVFTSLYEKKLIYRGERIIPWDPVQQTALSNIEVIYQEVQGKMYYFKYFLVGSKTDFLVIATTRPETMFADQAVIVNPKDNRYQKYWNQKVINPATGDEIPVLTDEYVDINFGTGAMKCTPAHDFNDYKIGQRHQLKNISCMNLNGTLNKLAGKWENYDRLIIRDKLTAELFNKNLVVKIEEHTHQVGFSERSKSVVEPMLSTQWFIDMKAFAQQIINYQNSDDKVNFFPNRFNETLINWMENIQDWCISRQIWWGHQIPAWYHKETNEIYVGINPPNDINSWIQDSDVLDTWFSSSLWPFVGLGWQNDVNLFNSYYPTDVLVTGYDIIFFWVSRMMVQGLEFTGKMPFKDVLIHGLIRDSEGQKMSKSLGNGVDPMEVIETYGSDALRFFLVTNSTPGQDLRYSPVKIEAAWNFINKLWNAARFVVMSLPDGFKIDEHFISKYLVNHNSLVNWILLELLEMKNNFLALMNKYEFALAGKIITDFVWDKYCSWFIEFSKINHKLAIYDQNIINQSLVFILKEILILMHPFIPFVTEEIYQFLNLKTSILQEQIDIFSFNLPTSCFIPNIIKVITALREIRAQYNLSKGIEIEYILNNIDNIFSIEELKIINKFTSVMVNAYYQHKLIITKTKNIIIPMDNFVLEISNNNLVDQDAEVARLTLKLEELQNEINRCEKILNNKNFISKAKPEKIALEQNKLKKYQLEYDEIIAQLTLWEQNK